MVYHSESPFDAGYSAHQNGKDRSSNPHLLGSKQYLSWLNGYDYRDSIFRTEDEEIEG